MIVILVFFVISDRLKLKMNCLRIHSRPGTCSECDSYSITSYIAAEENGIYCCKSLIRINDGSFWEHVKNFHTTSYYCKCCHFLAETDAKIREHIKSHYHSYNGIKYMNKGVVMCCSENFKKFSSYEEHRKKHKKDHFSFSCGVCNEKYDSYCGFITHLVTDKHVKNM